MISTEVMAFIVSLIIVLLSCPYFIPYLTKLKFGQNVRDDGPKSHIQKSGTPTMGGITIILGFAIGAILFVRENDALVAILVTLAFGSVGFLDDYIKIVKKRSLGLRAKEKIILQLLITAIFCYYLYEIKGIDTRVVIPFLSNKYSLDLGMFYYPFIFIAVIGTVNAANLTDGLDGLATGVTLIISCFFIFIAKSLGTQISVVASAAAGSLLAFLLFNTYPAKIFMGDTGSLALGGFVAVSAVLMKIPLFIVIVGIIYVIEALSVIMQVSYFKISKGKRIFKMAPFHHHLELCGWKETKVVAVFYFVTALMCLIGYLAFFGV